MGTEGGVERDDDTMRGRASASRTKLWVLLEANRWILTGVILATVFATLVGISVLSPVPLRTIVGRSDPVGTVFQALVTGIITGVTLVVTITQLVLSQELGPLGDQRERMDDAMDVRTDSETLLDEPISPLEPAAYLREIVLATRTRAQTLQAAVDAGADDLVRTRVRSLVETVTRDADPVIDRLETAEFGTYEVVSAALDFNYSVKMYDARRLREDHGEALSAEADRATGELVELLGYYAAAREHVKTLYFQWELSNLTREILYATIPALVVALASVLYLDATGTVTGTTLGVDNLVWVVSAAVTVSVTPFVLLLTYVLRVATIAKRTLAIGPFALRTTDASEGVDWNDGD